MKTSVPMFTMTALAAAIAMPALASDVRPAPEQVPAAGKNYFADVDDQFEGEIWKRSGEPLHVQCVHKTFTDYFDGLRLAGFSRMPGVRELTVTPELAATDETFFGPLLNTPLHVLFDVAK